jgi:hypothetical protein
MNKGKYILFLLIIIFLNGCGRNNWRAQYSGNEHRKVTPALLEILTNPDKKINKNE